MKNLRRWILAAGMMLLLFAAMPVQVITAKTVFVPVTGTVRNQDDTSDDESSENFITDAIKSIDEYTADKEKDKNYIRNFFNSAQTAMTDGLNLFHPSTIIMAMLNMITMMIEMLMGGLTFIVMILYNFISTSFMSTMVQNIFAIIDNVMFKWSDPNSWIMKVLVITALAGIGYQMIKNFTHMTNWKQILMVVLSGFLSMSFIIFIGQYGRTIAGSLEQTLQSMIVQSFVFEGQDENMELANKDNIFNILQMQPFMLRHFGTASYIRLAEQSGQTVEEAKARVQALLDQPDEDNAEKEYDDYDNTAISHDILSCSIVMFLSIITMIHRILIGVVLIILCVLNGAVKLAKEIMLALSVYQLIWWLIRRDHKAREWFIDRIMWSFAVIAVDLIFNVVMYFILEACSSISSVNALLLIAFDILLICIFMFVYKRAGSIGAKLRDSGGTVMKAMLTGSDSPIEVLQGLRGHPGIKSANDGIESNNSNRSDSYDDQMDLYDRNDDTSSNSGLSDDLFDRNETSDDHTYTDEHDDAKEHIDAFDEEEAHQNTGTESDAEETADDINANQKTLSSTDEAQEIDVHEEDADHKETNEDDDKNIEDNDQASLQEDDDAAAVHGDEDIDPESLAEVENHPSSKQNDEDSADDSQFGEDDLSDHADDLEFHEDEYQSDYSQEEKEDNSSDDEAENNVQSKEDQSEKTDIETISNGQRIDDGHSSSVNEIDEASPKVLEESSSDDELDFSDLQQMGKQNDDEDYT